MIQKINISEYLVTEKPLLTEEQLENIKEVGRRQVQRMEDHILVLILDGIPPVPKCVQENPHLFTPSTDNLHPPESHSPIITRRKFDFSVTDNS